MRIIISGKQFKVDQNLKNYINERFLKFARFVKEPATLEIVLSNFMGPKGNDQAVCVTATLPGLKNPIHIEEVTADFKGSIDVIEERLEKVLFKYKDQIKTGSRFPKKYYEAKLEEEEAGEI